MTYLRIILTGHRPGRLNYHGADGYDRNNPLRRALRRHMRDVFACIAAEHHPCEAVLVTGGALGIDWDGAGVALRMGMAYEVYVPFHGQESRWPGDVQIAHGELLQRASRVVVCHEGRPFSDAHAGCLLLARNLRMLADCPEAARRVVGVYDGGKGGTGQCVQAAQRDFGLPVHVVTPAQVMRDIPEDDAARRRAVGGVTVV